MPLSNSHEFWNFTQRAVEAFQRPPLAVGHLREPSDSLDCNGHRRRQFIVVQPSVCRLFFEAGRAVQRERSRVERGTAADDSLTTFLFAFLTRLRSPSIVLHVRTQHEHSLGVHEKLNAEPLPLPRRPPATHRLEPIVPARKGSALRSTCNGNSHQWLRRPASNLSRPVSRLQFLFSSSAPCVRLANSPIVDRECLIQYPARSTKCELAANLLEVPGEAWPCMLCCCLFRRLPGPGQYGCLRR